MLDNEVVSSFGFTGLPDDDPFWTAEQMPVGGHRRSIHSSLVSGLIFTHERSYTYDCLGCHYVPVNEMGP